MALGRWHGLWVHVLTTKPASNSAGSCVREQMEASQYVSEYLKVMNQAIECFFKMWFLLPWQLYLHNDPESKVWTVNSQISQSSELIQRTFFSGPGPASFGCSPVIPSYLVYCVHLHVQSVHTLCHPLTMPLAPTKDLEGLGSCFGSVCVFDQGMLATWSVA